MSINLFFSLFAGLILVLPIDQANDLVVDGDIAGASALLCRSLPDASAADRSAIAFNLALMDTDPVNAAEALKGIPTSSAQLALGELFLLMGNPAEAIGPLALAAKAREGAVSERAAWLRGIALLDAGRETEAREAFSDYLVTYLEMTYQTPARLGIALANERLGAKRAAGEIYKAILAQSPPPSGSPGLRDEPWILARLVEIFKEESPAEAERYRARLRSMNPEYAAEAAVPAQPVPVPPPLPAAVPVARTPQAVYALQVGAFGTRVNAEKQLKLFQQKGHRGLITKRGALYVVEAGTFRTETDASAAMPEFRKIAGGKVILVKKSTPPAAGREGN